MGVTKQANEEGAIFKQSAGGLSFLLPGLQGYIVSWSIKILVKALKQLPFVSKIIANGKLNSEASNPPSAIGYDGLVYYFYIDTPGECIQQQTLNPADDTPEWTTAGKIPGMICLSSCGTATFQNQLYVFTATVYTGAAGGGTGNGLQYAVWNNTHWVIYMFPLGGNEDDIGQNGATAVLQGVPSPAAFNDSLYVFYEGVTSGQLCYTVSTNGTSWAPSAQVSNVTVGASPSAVAFTNIVTDQTSLYVFFQSGTGNQLQYNVLDANGTWSGVQTVPTATYMEDIPVTFVADGILCVMYDGGGGDSYVVASADGSTWSESIQIAGIQLTNGPGLVQFTDFHLDASIMAGVPSPAGFNNSIYMVYQGSESNNGQLWYESSTDGVNWCSNTPVIYSGTSPACLSYSPSSVVFANPANGSQQALYAFYLWSASDADYQIFYEVLDTSGNWTHYNPIAGISDAQGSPIAFVAGTTLNVMYADTEGNLWIVSSTDGNAWGTPVACNLTGNLTCYPSVSAFNGLLYAFFPNSTGYMSCAISTNGTDWSVDPVPGSGTFSSPVGGVGVTDRPASIVFSSPSGGTGNSLYVIHQGWVDYHQLWFNVMDESSTWRGDTQITGVSIYGCPVAAVSGGSLYVFYAESDGRIWSVSTSDGTTWSDPTVCAQTGLPTPGPSQTQLLCTMMGPGNDGQIWAAAANSNNPWSVMTKIPNASTSTNTQDGIAYRPSPIVFNNRLFCFSQNSNNLLYNYFDGNKWSEQETALSNVMTNSPAPVILGDTLYVFFNGNGSTSNGWMYYTTSTDGSSFSSPIAVPNQGMSYEPSAVVFGGNLYVFCTAAKEGHSLWYSVFSGGSWGSDNKGNSTQMSVPNISYNGVVPPGAVVYNGNLYVFYIGSSWGICYTQYQGGNSWSEPIVLGTSAGGPYTTGYFTPFVFDGGNGSVLSLYYQGYSNNGYLYVGSTTDPSSASNWSTPGQVGVPDSQVETAGVVQITAKSIGMTVHCLKWAFM